MGPLVFAPVRAEVERLLGLNVYLSVDEWRRLAGFVPDHALQQGQLVAVFGFAADLPVVTVKHKVGLQLHHVSNVLAVNLL